MAVKNSKRRRGSSTLKYDNHAIHVGEMRHHITLNVSLVSFAIHIFIGSLLKAMVLYNVLSDCGLWGLVITY